MMIRPMQASDERIVKRLMIRYLKETFEQGGEFPPTLENAAAFTAYAIQGAAEGDPCLVAVDSEKVVGFIAARGMGFPGTTSRHKTIRSWGSFVLPEYRSKNVATTLFIVAGRLARVAGYTRFLGMTYGTDYEKHALGVVDRIPGMQEVGKVLVMDLTRKTKQAQEAEAPVHVE
jgi:GNAT superfamily N-acetyltransferase